MDHETFDRIVRLLGTPGSRRAALGGLLGGGALGAVETALGKTKRKHRGKNRGKARGKQDRKGKQRSARQAQAEAACFTGSPCIPGPGKNLGKCDFGGSPALRNKNLKGANLGGANLADADASGANFSGANLGACLVDANLTGAVFNGSTNTGSAIFCRTTMPDGSENNSGCGKGTTCCPTCDAANPCPTGQLCCNGRCRNVECCGTGQQSTCPSGQTCCGNACFDLDDDIDNCGACGNACDPDGECIGGDCFGPVMDVILAGGPAPTTSILVDDDLRLELNGQVIFNDNNGLASTIPPIPFQARNGDSLRIVATDALAFCHRLSPLYLHAAVGGAAQTLDAVGVPLTCPGVAVGVFYDETFTINL